MARNFVRASSDKAENTVSAPVTAAPFTVSVWCKTDVDVTSDDHCVLQIQDKDGANDYWRLTADGSVSNGQFLFYATDANAAIAYSGVVPSIGTWYHVACLEKASNSRKIIVGDNSGTDTTAKTPDNIDSITIGYEGDSSPGDGWDGDIAEVAVWEIELAEAEIDVLQLGVSPLMVRPQNLVFYAPLIGKTSPEIEIVGGRALTLSGTTAIAHPKVIYPAPPMFYGEPSAVSGYTLTADQGSYTLSGQTVLPLVDRKMIADQGSYSLTGQATNVLRGFLVTVLQGSYTLSGQAAGLLVDRLIAAAQGSYTLTGQDADLLMGHLLTADQGSYSLTGQATNLLFGRLLSAAQGSYTLSGQDANLLIARLLTAAQGSYTLTGQDVTLTYTPVGGYTLVAESGSYALSGQTVGLLMGHLLTADQGGYALSGQAAEILKGFYISAAQGSYTLTGQAATLLVDYVLALDQGSYTLTGQDSTLTYTSVAAPAARKLGLHRLRYDRLNALGKPGKRYNRLRGRFRR
ncbi:MAG: hypothetical protein IMY80_07575 [Chloroflexi bacterium]|nr:hypothetical protein [Chloroflexota bacterium]